MNILIYKALLILLCGIVEPLKRVYNSIEYSYLKNEPLLLWIRLVTVIPGYEMYWSDNADNVQSKIKVTSRCVQRFFSVQESKYDLRGIF